MNKQFRMADVITELNANICPICGRYKNYTKTHCIRCQLQIERIVRDLLYVPTEEEIAQSLRNQKRLEQMRRPKCECGNHLSDLKIKEGIPYCPRCEREMNPNFRNYWGLPPKGYTPPLTHEKEKWR